MIIGLDFDNTIVCYDDVFYTAALEKHLVTSESPLSKTEVRDTLRAAGKEQDWIELQGYVYGPGMKLAKPFPGAIDCITSLLAADHQVFIISHRSKHPYGGPQYDLHAAAKEWLAANNFFEAAGFTEAEAFFNETKEDKLARIAAQDCDFFVDDLPEFLLMEEFYPKAKKILFDPHSLHEDKDSQLKRVTNWEGVKASLLA